MPRESDDESLNAFVQLRCLCGKVHTLLRETVVSGLGVSRSKCASCSRRFVVACTPEVEGVAETFWPLFLENVPSTGDTQEEGLSVGSTSASKPDEVHFQCRCSCRLVGRGHTIGKPVRCPKCRSRIVLRIGYHNDDGTPLPLLEYPDDEGIVEGKNKPPSSGDDEKDPWKRLGG